MGPSTQKKKSIKKWKNNTKKNKNEEINNKYQNIMSKKIEFYKNKKKEKYIEIAPREEIEIEEIKLSYKKEVYEKVQESEKKENNEEEEEYKELPTFNDENYFSNNTSYVRYLPFNLSSEGQNNKKHSYVNVFEGSDITSLLQIPRIKPKNPQDIIKIKEKVISHGLTLFKLEQKEKKLYMGSFPLTNEENDNEINVPAFKEKYTWRKQKDFPKLKEFDEDNDVLTDDEQLGLEIKRAYDAIDQFMKFVETKKRYVKKRVSRKGKEYDTKKLNGTLEEEEEDDSDENENENDNGENEKNEDEDEDKGNEENNNDDEENDESFIPNDDNDNKNEDSYIEDDEIENDDDNNNVDNNDDKIMIDE